MLSPIRIAKGLDLKLPGAPTQSIRTGPALSKVALCGADLVGIRPRFEVAVGDRVRTGEVLFRDATRPQLVWTAPACGVVSQLSLGRRRSLNLLEIELHEGTPVEFDRPGARPTVEQARQLLLQSGAWNALRTRPYGRVPDPDADVHAIFVNAMDSRPLAADPKTVLAEHAALFRSGLACLKSLLEGGVVVCQAPGEPLVESDPQLRCVAFAGPHPAGLPGTHIHALMPASAQRQIWQIDYQEVIAIGHLWDSGRLYNRRIVALGGSGVLEPGLLRTQLGARIDQLTAGQLAPGPTEVISGSVLDGRIATHLGRFHHQICVLKQPAPAGLWTRLLSWLPSAGRGPMIPLATLDRLLPFDILPTPLLRALSVGDLDSAAALGCAELLEEDLALLSHYCVGKTNYGLLLRQMLDQLAADTA